MQWKPNTTVAALAAKNGKYLMIEEEIQGRYVFNQPAGHLEYNESLLTAVKREVREETAWDFEPQTLIGIYLYPNPNDNSITYLRFCFYGQCIKHYPEQSLDKGILRTHWLSPEDIRIQIDKMRSPMVLHCIEDHLAGKSYPLNILHYE